MNVVVDTSYEREKHAFEEFSKTFQSDELQSNDADTFLVKQQARLKNHPELLTVNVALLTWIHATEETAFSASENFFKVVAQSLTQTARTRYMFTAVFIESGSKPLLEVEVAYLVKCAVDLLIE